MLAARYPSPEWALFFEVQNGTGWYGPGRSRIRRADALAFGIWQSRGYAVHGFEIKRSRSDWLRELADPKKADAIGTFCDRWWLVLDNAKIALDSEVPETWGILCPKGDKLTVLRDAPKREAVPLTRPQLAAVLRQVGESTVPKALVDSRIAASVAEATARASRQRDYESMSNMTELEQLKKEVAAFEAESGILITRYSGGQSLGKAVARVRALSGVTGNRRLEQAKEMLQDLVRNIDIDLETLAALQEIQTPAAE